MSIELLAAALVGGCWLRECCRTRALARQVDWLTLEVERLRAVETKCQALRAEQPQGEPRRDTRGRFTKAGT